MSQWKMFTSNSGSYLSKSNPVQSGCPDYTVHVSLNTKDHSIN